MVSTLTRFPSIETNFIGGIVGFGNPELRFHYGKPENSDLEVWQSSVLDIGAELFYYCVK